MTDDEIIAAYKQHMERKRRSPNTVRNRGYKLGALSKGLGATPIVEADRHQLEAFIDSRGTRARPLTDKGRYDWASMLNAFYAWASIEGYVTENPAEHLVRPEVEKGLPRPVSYAHIDRAATAAGPMMRAWVLLAGLNGLRCMEIAHLHREQVDELAARPTLRIVGKGKHERIVTLHPDVIDALEQYGMPKRGRVFVGPKGVGYSPAQVSGRINRFLRANGVDATAHQLRHAFATELLHVSGNIKIVQEMLGHRDPSSTAIYAKLRNEDAADAIYRLQLNDAHTAPARDREAAEHLDGALG